MNKLNNLLEMHINSIQLEFDCLPKSNKNSGNFSGLMNKLDDTIMFTEKVDNIVNTENRKMIDYVNENYLDDYTDKEMNAFLEVAKERYAEIIKEGLVSSLN